MTALAQLRDDYAARTSWLRGTAAVPNRQARRARDASARKPGSPLERTGEVARTIGSLVWSAQDETDLIDILDAHANDPAAWDDVRRVVGALYGGAFNKIPDPFTFVQRVCAKAPERASVLANLFEGNRIAAIIADLFNKHDQSTFPEEWKSLDLYSVPVPMLNCILEHERGTACHAALIDLVISDRPRPPGWLVDSVSQRWVQGERKMVQTISILFDDDDVPDDLVPPEQRLRRGQIGEENREAQSVFDRFIERTAAFQ